MNDLVDKMEQPKEENVEQNPSNDPNETNDDIKQEAVPSTSESQPCIAQEMEDSSADILVDPLKIEPVVTEITTEIVSVVVENDDPAPDGLSKGGDTNSQTSFEVQEQVLEVVCAGQSDSSNIEAEVIEGDETLDNSTNTETILPDLIKPDGVRDSEDPNLSADVPQDTEEVEEVVEYIEENVIAVETCDPSAMNVVEEIVTTSKSSYSVEIQEQDSTDGRDSFVTKDLVMLEVGSETEETIEVVEEDIGETDIEQSQDCDSNSNSEKLPGETLLSQADVEDNSQSSVEIEAKNTPTKVADENTKSVVIIDKTTETKAKVEKKESPIVDKNNVAKKTENHRSVIQEIVDDWIDDTNDDICESKSNAGDSHDAVEIELKTLLADDKPTHKDNKIAKEGNKSPNKNLNQGKVGVNLRKSRNIKEFSAKKRVNGLENKSKSSKSEATIGEKLPKKETETISKYIPHHSLIKSVTNPIPPTTIYKQKTQPSKPGVKVSGRHLMSQIASKAEVTEVLKERIKQKQKEIELPQGGDILFVKKITQRLSSKLSAASTHGFSGKKKLPQLLNVSSENYSNNSSDERKVDDAEKIESADNRELLAILEGDVDPDWSNLKPHSVTEASKSSELGPETIVAGKLDPSMERELALKQLLELPTISIKKNTIKKRRTFKPAPSKVSLSDDQTTSNVDATQTTVSPIDSETVPILATEDDDPVLKMDIGIKTEEMDIGAEEAVIEESRSGRKRKPTEKAREREENSTKKQKVYKGKVTDHKKSPKLQVLSDDSVQEPAELEEEPRESEPVLVNPKPTGRNILSKIGPTKNRIYQAKSTKMGNKLAQNIAKRNITVKKFLRQKSATNVTNPKTVPMKSKFIGSPKKYRNAIKQKVQKRLLDVSSSEIKPKKKSNEIDKLLQDEGVVNLLYDVEQPERKRLIPITKSQTKVMDLHKVQRELKIRTKLVRNAVLRLRTSSGSPTKISSRSKRTLSSINVTENETRDNERNKSIRSSISSSTDFIFPAKIRNAADASVIVRRHSSSSFSSTSGSPRASIDGPDKHMEPSGSDEGPAHVTRSARRRHSQNEKNKQFTEVLLTPKKNGSNRKKSTENADNQSIVSTEKGVPATRPNLRTESKNVEKTNKNIENVDIGKSSSNGSGSKITTRSNGMPVEKEIIKTKKGTKTKVISSKGKDAIENEMEVVAEDKLSACLAEAASALSNVDGTANQSGSSTPNRKLRTPSVPPKAIEKSPPDVLDQFNNKEINLRRHGNIVQLILTPSSTRLKNGITLQLMHELREALLLLRRDEACRIVLVTSTGPTFCEGLDLSNLIHDNKEERRAHAEEMANGVKEFMKTLANFNKPIVAGIQGAAIGISVTMLPLFDLVIASDKATFSTPYGQLGQIPEGAAILTLSQTVGNTITSELLLGGRTLTASEALRAGLVTRVLWPDRFQGELIPSLRAMSEHSSQSMEATKTLLRHSLRKKLDAALESESYLLIQHWCSAECQMLIKSYLDGKGH